MASREPFQVTITPDFNGIVAVYGDTIHFLHDDDCTIPNLNPVKRAVLVARLRTWADILDGDPS